MCVADGMYLIEQAGVIIDWIIACNCPNYTTGYIKITYVFHVVHLVLFTDEKFVLISHS